MRRAWTLVGIAVVSAAATFGLGTAAAVLSAPSDLTLPVGTPSVEVVPVESTAGFAADSWSMWASVGGDCDRWDATLQDHDRSSSAVLDCLPVEGEWISALDGSGSCPTAGGVWTDAGCHLDDLIDVDVTQVVPLVEAHRSGAAEWDDARREAFANDPAGLVVTSTSSVMARADRDPATWVPVADRCGYVRHWLEIKSQWGLSADQDEVNAIAAVLERC